MAKAGTMRINIKANSLPDGLTPDSNADTKDSSNANVVKKKAKRMRRELILPIIAPAPQQLRSNCGGSN